MLDDAVARAARLGEIHVAPLEAWRTTVAGDRPVPHFDPLDGGTEARLLILLETPGPGDVSLRFVSRDNSSGTQRNLARFLDEAGIERQAMVLWNCVPWIVHQPGALNRQLRQSEFVDGLATLPGLLALLPKLKTIVLAGRVAQQAVPILKHERPELDILTMPHPSPANVCTSPNVALAIRDTLTNVKQIITDLY